MYRVFHIKLHKRKRQYASSIGLRRAYDSSLDSLNAPVFVFEKAEACYAYSFSSVSIFF